MGSNLRPGFHLDGSFNAHRATVRQVVFNSKRQYYISLDDKCVRAWCSGPKVKQLAVLHFPAFQPSFITSIAYADKIELLFASALDKSIKLYNDKLDLRASLSWDAGAVLSMVYNDKFDELITAGSDGVKVWFSEPDFESYYFDGREPFERAKRNKVTGEYVKWTFGQHQSAQERMTLRVPGANLRCVLAPNAAIANGEWCHRLILERKSEVLIVMLLGSVYIFDIITGSRIHQWEALHTQPVTGVIYLPAKLMVFTSSQDASVVQWQMMADGSLKMFRRITDITTPVSGMLFQQHAQAILTSSFDGMITLWSLESLESTFRMKVPGAVLGLSPHGEEKFFFHYDKNIKVMRLRHIFTTFKICNSKPRQLRTLDNGQIAALLEDTSLRVMDIAGKDKFTTVPQLSTKSVIETDYCPERQKLIVLFGDGCIHIWQIQACNPPRLAKVWIHLMKENPTSFRFLRKDLVPSTMTTLGRGLVRSSPLGDILIVGTKVGDLILCDMKTSQVLSRTSGFEKEPVLGIALDSSTENLLVHSHKLAKILRLGSFSHASQLYVSDEISKIAVNCGKGLIGGNSGRLLLVDLCSGRHLQTPQSLYHTRRVTAISTHPSLPYFITASMDGSIQIVHRNTGAHARVVAGGPVECACLLNNKGDVLIGVGSRLFAAKSDVYLKYFKEGVMVNCAVCKGNVESNLDGDAQKASWDGGKGLVAPMNGLNEPNSPTSSPKQCLVFETLQNRFELLELNRRPPRLEIANGIPSSSLHADPGPALDQDLHHLKSPQNCATSCNLLCTQYTVQLPMPESEEDEADLLKRRISNASDLDYRSDNHNSSQFEDLSTPCESSSEHSSFVAAARSNNCCEALEESFRRVAPIIASKTAFYPGFPEPLPAAPKTKRRKKKIGKGGRRRRRKPKKISSRVSLSWEDRTEQLRKTTIENKVILGVHELRAQEAGTKSAVNCILPKAPKLANVTQATPVGFVPR